MIFSEDSRVKIPCILHLVRLGYRYLPLRNAEWDEETNISPALFRDSVARINPELAAADIARVLDDVKLALDNEDLGQAFYKRLIQRSGTRLIDFTDFSNNS
jgi:type I restriction enzyme R subunit